MRSAVGPCVALECSLASIDGQNSAIGAFTSVLRVEARGAALASTQRLAERVPGRLEGLLFAAKENFDVAGRPTRGGMTVARPPVSEDAAAIASLRSAGAILVGLTAMDEAALGASGDNPHFGRCQNPSFPGRSPGGSSSGSAAAVAAGWVDFALGSDTLGSVRIPAAYCGIIGFKPSRGRIDRQGVLPLAPSLDEVGIFTRELSMLDAVFHVLGDSAPSRDIGLRTLVLARPGGIHNVPVTHRVERAFDQVLDQLRRAGVHLVDAPMSQWDPIETRKAGFLVVEAEAAVVHRAELAVPNSGLSPRLRGLLSYGRDCSQERIARAFEVLQRAREAAFDAFEATNATALVMPTVTDVAPPYDATPDPNQAAFTTLANAGGLPAITLPLPANEDGAPALQLVGLPGEDEDLLATSRKIAAIIAR